MWVYLHLCVRSHPTLHEASQDISLCSGHMAAARLYEHGKSHVPEEQLRPAVLTINVTLAL